MLFPVLLGAGGLSVVFGLEVVDFGIGLGTIFGVGLGLGVGFGVLTPFEGDGLIIFSSSPFMQSDCPLFTQAEGMHLRSLGQKKSLLDGQEDVEVLAAWLELQTIRRKNGQF